MTTHGQILEGKRRLELAWQPELLNAQTTGENRKAAGYPGQAAADIEKTRQLLAVGSVDC